MADLQNKGKDRTKPEEKIKRGLTDVSGGIGGFFKNLIDLKEGLDREGTIVNIKNNKKMAGANAWLLMCSIMIASIGLDNNSPAVIIGAMLISPLMSPILGIGLAVGINDRKTLSISLKHFAISIGIAIVTSTLYFWFTPIGEPTDEIISRTKPTILDVMVAYFGGIAGIISGSRKDKSNAIPGVAIATALMPPLCVTGFGIANANWTVMVNSFYLFFLNATFVALATYLIVRLLDFPVHEYIDMKERRKTKFISVLIITILLVPSAFILFDLLTEINTKNNIKSYLTEFCADDKKYIDSWEHIPTGDSAKLILKVYAGSNINEKNIDYYRDGLQKYNLNKTNIEIISTSEVPLKKFNLLQNKVSDFEEVYKQLESERKTKSAQEMELQQLRQTLDSLENNRFTFSQLSDEASILFPNLENFALTYGQQSNFDNAADTVAMLVLKWRPNLGKKQLAIQEKKLSRFIQTRTKIDSLQIIRQ